MQKLSFLCVGVLGLILTIVSCQSVVSDGAVLKPTGDSMTFSLNPKTTVLILMLDTATRQLSEFELRFPPVLSSEELSRGTLSVESAYGQCYDGTNFLYSFFFDENIFVVSPDGKPERKVKAKSRYLDRIYADKRVPSDLDNLAKTLCEIPFYGVLIYDKYRDV